MRNVKCAPLFLLGIFFANLTYSQWTTVSGSPNDITTTNSGNVGIGKNPSGYKLDVNGYIHSNLMLINDAPSAGAVGGWFRGASSGNANIVIQSNAGSGAAWWLTGGPVFKIGGTAGTEPATGAINITTSGSVGIGTTSPRKMLEVATTSQLDGLMVSYNNAGWATLNGPSMYAAAFNNIVQNGDAGIIFGPNPSASTFGFVIAPFTNGPGGLRVDWTGNILIGKGTQTNTGYMLDVNGNARMNQVVVNTSGADYVFDAGYHLTPLNELATYLKQERHLPGILPAAQMQQQGLDLGDNQTKLLAKIEELTLYIIEQNKKIDNLNSRLEKIEAKHR